MVVVVVVCIRLVARLKPKRIDLLQLRVCPHPIRKETKLH